MLYLGSGADVRLATTRGEQQRADGMTKHRAGLLWTHLVYLAALWLVRELWPAVMQHWALRNLWLGYVFTFSFQANTDVLLLGVAAVAPLFCDGRPVLAQDYFRQSVNRN